MSYHFWCAATVVGGALKRRVWVNRGDWKLFPNLFTVLVGHGGLGKGRAINPAVGLLREAGVVNIMTDRMTIQYILEALSKGFATVTPGTASGGVTVGVSVDASCFISAPELQTLLTMSDATGSLSELWEGKDGPSDYGTLSRKLFQITKPCPSLLGGCTPRQVIKMLNPDVVQGGFTRRVNFIYSAENDRSIPFPPQSPAQDKVRDHLVHDLKQLTMLNGEFKFTTDAAEAFVAYYKSVNTSEFQDEATFTYETTKWAQATKLAMSISAAEADDLIITRQHFDDATRYVDACLVDLKKVFRAVGDSELTVAMERVMRFVEVKGNTTRQEILYTLWKEIGSTYVLDTILATLEQGELIVRENKGGRTVFRLPITP